MKNAKSEAVARSKLCPSPLFVHEDGKSPAGGRYTIAQIDGGNPVTVRTIGIGGYKTIQKIRYG